MGSTLGHVMVVGGTRRDFAAIGADQWTARAEELGTVVADAGGSWLTVRAYERGPSADEVGHAALGRRTLVVAGGRCTAMIDPESDGRWRFAEAMRHLPPGAVVDEKAVAGVLYEPADVEPDLVLVLGPPIRLPPSLVWELAYGELVFDDRALADLHAAHVRGAIEEFKGRQRRFGGLES